MVGSPSRAVLCILFLTIQAFGCSDDDDDPKRESGTCDGSVSGYTCTEVEGDAAVISDEREFCSDLGDTWATEPCPTANLVGCCRYEFGGGNYLECNYTGHPDAAPEETCTFWDGTWSAGSR
jgi:hypothetical protein